jgi:hypothetical protein
LKWIPQHHLVVNAKGPSEPRNRRLALIAVEGRLQIEIERPRSEAAPIHQAEHLHVTNRIASEATRNAVANDLNDLAGNVIGIGGFDDPLPA